MDCRRANWRHSNGANANAAFVAVAVFLVVCLWGHEVRAERQGQKEPRGSHSFSRLVRGGWENEGFVTGESTTEKQQHSVVVQRDAPKHVNHTMDYTEVPLQRYHSSIQLASKGTNITLYWSLARHHIHFAVHLQPATSQTPSSRSSISFSSHGWGAIGWSSSPAMAPSDAVIWDLPRDSQLLAGGRGGLVAVHISGRNKSAIKLSKEIELKRVSMTHSDNNGTTVRFTRRLDDGSFPIGGTRLLFIHWAHAKATSRDTLSYHGPYRGSIISPIFPLPPSPPSSSPSAPPPAPSPFLIAHIVLSTIAFALLLPATAIISRLFLIQRPGEFVPVSRRFSPPQHSSSNNTANDGTLPGCLFSFGQSKHSRNNSSLMRSLSRSSNGSGMMFYGMWLPHWLMPREWQADCRRRFWYLVHKWVSVLAVLTAVVGFAIPFVGIGSNGIYNSHSRTGCVLIGLLVLQPILGFLRPPKGQGIRQVWHYAHWFFGLSCIVIGWVDSLLGVPVYTSKYGGTLEWFVILFSALIGSFSLIYLAVTSRDVFSRFTAAACSRACIGPSTTPAVSIATDKHVQTTLTSRIQPEDRQAGSSEREGKVEVEGREGEAEMGSVSPKVHDDGPGEPVAVRESTMAHIPPAS